MKSILLQKQWSWLLSGFMLGMSFLLAVVLVKPIGVSTQYPIVDGILWEQVQPDLVTENGENKSGYGSSNAYFNENGGKYAAAIAKPLTYGLVFVLAMILGGFVARITQRSGQPELYTPSMVSSELNSMRLKRLQRVFVGGFLALLGARLAGGCTSGHMMSGMMQTSLSGFLFAAAAFAAAIPMALYLYGREE
ncbi:YeeE/YedE family protein [Desulforhopalus vacuolatus]|uniref:YeeE/YedE thiosulfate transporter family protein n=1 Tax=Desulforhopalus vacuolatus TaxID=40414 RepID=UPI001965CD4B|nr:YeeE/YedE thiosulfate transporter family protein [Desulforhopalus vacuolatus]MBM9519730.1 YeeE/YedE family protein [Desulforhopalus vacuolatus]